MPRKAQTIKKDYISDFNDGIGDEENVSPSSGKLEEIKVLFVH